MLKVTCDQSANLKLLRRLELEGGIELFAISIEMMRQTGRIRPDHKQQPIAVWDSPHSTWDNAVFAPQDTAYSEIEEIIGKSNHADVLHLEGHISSGRDVFVTSDTDFLKHKDVIHQRFGATIMTAEELERSLPSMLSPGR